MGGGRIVYEQTNMAAELNSDIDLNTNAPNAAVVEFATGASWKAVAAGYAALADPEMIPAETQSVLPADLPAERMQRIGAIVAVLHKQVRYTGVEFGAAKLTPPASGGGAGPALRRLQRQGDAAAWRCCGRRGFRPMWRCFRPGRAATLIRGCRG